MYKLQTKLINSDMIIIMINQEQSLPVAYPHD